MGKNRGEKESFFRMSAGLHCWYIFSLIALSRMVSANTREGKKHEMKVWKIESLQNIVFDIFTLFDGIRRCGS